MKLKIFYTLILVCTISVAPLSQTKQISSNEFYINNYNAQKMLAERSWRIETKTDSMENGSVIMTETKIHEQLLPDKTRFLIIEKNGSKENRSELIRIGFMEYRRENDKPWISIDTRGSGSGSGSGSGTSVSCAQYTEELDFVGGISARKQIQFLIERAPNGLSFDDFRIWLNQDGSFVRSERIKGLLEPRIEKTHSVVTYEYNPNIKIEAPIK
jgi:hypothetical protein